jgi:protein SCO1/2
VPSRTTSAAGLTVAAVLAAAAALAWRNGAAPKLPVLGALPDFELTAQSGSAFGSRQLAGRPWLADFIFTRCGGVCPAMTARLAQLRKQLAPDVALVSFTVDPGHDTPEVLARYASDFHAGEGWTFLSGPQPRLYALAVQGFKLEAFEVPPDQQVKGGDGPFLHSSKYVLLDGRSRIRGYYDSSDERALRQLLADVDRLRRDDP